MLVPGALMVAVPVSLVCTMSPAVTALEFESWAPLRNTEPVLFTTATPVFCAKTTGASPKRTRQMHLFERDELTQDAFGLMVTSSACRVNQLERGSPASNLRAPAVDQLPPHEFRPLVKVDLCPLPVFPPLAAKLRRV